MNTDLWEQHYVGRYLCKLPMGSKTTLSASYGLGGVRSTEIEYIEGIKKEDLPSIVMARIAVLRKQRNIKTGDSMFLGKIEFLNNGVGIVQWSSTTSDARKILECYFVAKGGQEYVFKFVHRMLWDEQPDFDASFCRLVGENLYSREPSEAPVGKGFVVDHGFLAVEGHTFLNDHTCIEKSQLDFSLPDFPAIGFELVVYNFAGEPRNLLDQVDPDYVLMNYSDKKVIRRGKHNAGDIPGQEICISGERDGATSFECQWGSSGKSNDLANQKLILEVQVRTHEKEGGYPTQEELLRLWDAIIETIRLRRDAA